MTAGTNWGGNVTYYATQITSPTSPAELPDAVATTQRLPLRAPRHPFNTMGDPDPPPDLPSSPHAPLAPACALILIAPAPAHSPARPAAGPHPALTPPPPPPTSHPFSLLSLFLPFLSPSLFPLSSSLPPSFPFFPSVSLLSL